ncbi:formate dehydrogenase accessory protein FdhE [Stutzerimonas azotifigens]|uniref:formate dehydrogenase accessory protein FdhE n=1 Tax=Stutzerimonas azotifigens TaxID=291995 RepID=UPI000486EFE7|nr:formate dehydrogenase accessory protein FdhE [Stutzerimonas azotifigens]
MKGPAVNHAFGSAPSGIMEPPRVVLPDHQLFARRAARLRTLSENTPGLGEFLAFIASVVQAQQQVLETREPAWVPAAGAFDAALEHGMPPLGAQALRRDIDWQQDLAALLDALELQAGERQRPLLASVRGLSVQALDDLAEQVLDADPGDSGSRGQMPLVAAALQVAWVRLTRALPRPPERPTGDVYALCPCCGSQPVASIVHVAPERNGVRYLHCAICATEWHLERVTCTICHKGGQLHYLGLEDGDQSAFVARAEACDHCHGYLKIVPREFDAEADPLADDLASLALDLMLDEAGQYTRSGYNPFLIAGA